MKYFFWPTQIKHEALFAEVFNVFSQDECEKIVKFAEHRLKPAALANGNILTDIRKTLDTALPYSEKTAWIYERIAEQILGVNRAHYNYELAGFFEDFGLLKYTEGSFYDKHMDWGFGGTSIRKLSFVLQLSNETEYSGGELEFFYSCKETRSAPKRQGSLIVFPSFLLHEVKPILKGERYSLVGWTSGPTWR